MTSLLLSEDGRDLIIGFGVNDCDSRVVRFPLALALAMTNETVRFGQVREREGGGERGIRKWKEKKRRRGQEEAGGGGGGGQGTPRR